MKHAPDDDIVLVDFETYRINSQSKFVVNDAL
jgi:hypothetical protein